MDTVGSGLCSFVLLIFFCFGIVGTWIAFGGVTFFGEVAGTTAGLVFTGVGFGFGAGFFTAGLFFFVTRLFFFVTAGLVLCTTGVGFGFGFGAAFFCGGGGTRLVLDEGTCTLVDVRGFGSATRFFGGSATLGGL